MTNSEPQRLKLLREMLATKLRLASGKVEKTHVVKMQRRQLAAQKIRKETK